MESLNSAFSPSEIENVATWFETLRNLLMDVRNRNSLTDSLPDWEQDRRNALWDVIRLLAPSVRHPWARLGVTWPLIRNPEEDAESEDHQRSSGSSLTSDIVACMTDYLDRWSF